MTVPVPELAGADRLQHKYITGPIIQPSPFKYNKPNSSCYNQQLSSPSASLTSVYRYTTVATTLIGTLLYCSGGAVAALAAHCLVSV